MNQNYPWPAYLFLCIALTFIGCSHSKKLPLLVHGKLDLNATHVLINHHDVTYIPKKERESAYIRIKNKKQYVIGQNRRNNSFSYELILNALMRNPKMHATLFRNKKKIKTIEAQKLVQPKKDTKNNAWGFGKKKLHFYFPHLNDGDELVITTHYDWMDTRFLPPIFFEDDTFVSQSSATINVPHGVLAHFQMAKDGEAHDTFLTNAPKKLKEWIRDENNDGLGAHYEFSVTNTPAPKKKFPSHYLQLFTRFEKSEPNESAIIFSSWEQVAQFLYQRIDRYDLPGPEVHKVSETIADDDYQHDEKIRSVIAYIGKNISLKPTPIFFYKGETQPASITIQKKSGSALDRAILTKAILSALGIYSEIIALGDSEKNPKLSEFFSPTLFSGIALAIKGNERTYFFDPAHPLSKPNNLAPRFQGQGALVVRSEGGYYFSIPFKNAHDNKRTITYNLEISESGKLFGSFSIELLGLEAFLPSKKLFKTPTFLSVSELVKMIDQHQTFYDWAGATLDEIIDPEYVSVQGHVAEELLLQKDEDSFVLELKPLRDLIFKKAQEMLNKNYLSTLNISINFTTPRHYNFVEIPNNYSLNKNGLSGRVSFLKKENQLTISSTFFLNKPMEKREKDEVLETLGKSPLKIVSPAIMQLDSKEVAEILDASDEKEKDTKKIE